MALFPFNLLINGFCQKKPLHPTANAKAMGLGGLVCGALSGAMEEKFELDLVCASKPGVSPLMAGERVVGHIYLGPRPHCDVVDASRTR